MYADIKVIEKNYKITEFPLNIGVEVTNHCNLNCIMCVNDSLKRPKGYMTMTMYKRIIDEVADKSPNTRIWLNFYGESLLAGWKLYYMIDYAKKAGCKNVCINTNGTLMHNEYADMLLDSGIDFISFDCDGFSTEVFEAIRRGANRDVFYKNVEYILEQKKKRNLNVKIDVTVIEMEKNKHEVKAIMDYWMSKGAWVTVRRMTTWGGSKPYGEEDKTVVSGECDRIACGRAMGTCNISWDGNVAGCAMDADCVASCGNVADESIEAIWKRRNEEFVSIHMEHRWDELPEMCKNCTDWQLIGENRYDDKGNEVVKKYDLDDSVFEKKCEDMSAL